MFIPWKSILSLLNIVFTFNAAFFLVQGAAKRTTKDIAILIQQKWGPSNISLGDHFIKETISARVGFLFLALALVAQSVNQLLPPRWDDFGAMNFCCFALLFIVLNLSFVGAGTLYTKWSLPRLMKKVKEEAEK